MSREIISLHGVFMEMRGVGVLLSGASGVGKSELALELLNRGHRLVADDASEFALSESGEPEGKCPELLRDFLEVRGLGVINIRSIFGDGSIADRAVLKLVVNLKAMTVEQVATVDRLRPSRDGVNILGQTVPRITLPVAPGRNLAILAEAALRCHILGLEGYDAAEDFNRRHRGLLTQGDI